MPRDTMASAMDRISASLTLQPKVFHEFQPMGGVAPKIAGAGAGRLASLLAASGATPAAPPAAALPWLLGATASPPASASPAGEPITTALEPACPPFTSGAVLPVAAAAGGAPGPAANRASDVLVLVLQANASAAVKQLSANRPCSVFVIASSSLPATADGPGDERDAE